MRSLLDDPRRIAQLDQSDMLGSIYRFPEPLLNPQGFEFRSGKGRRAPDALVLAGMGGSASAGDVLLDWLGGDFDVPSQVSRDPKLPRNVTEKTVVVCISYSGGTWETLQAFHEARKIGCQVAGVGSGGSLKDLCLKMRKPFFQVSPDGAPRAALTKMVVAGSAALQSLGVINHARRKLQEAGVELVKMRDEIEPAVPSSRNLAKQIALSLKGRTPIIYALNRMSSIARRFKNQLAENSKIVAKYELLPEACHNEIEGLADMPSTMVPIVIRDWEESSMEETVIRAFRSTIQTARRAEVLEVREKAESKLGRLLAPILILDYASAYLAIIRGVDPSPTRQIAEYKRRYASEKKRL